MSMVAVATSVGSSPRVRGKHVRRPPPPRERGLIPACAGKTVQVHGVSWPGPAHPRVCGENTIHVTTALGSEGSSPRVRGKHRPGIVDDTSGGSSPRVRGKRWRGVPIRDGEGLIPACAGKTTMMGELSDVGGAHPRVCGENWRGLARWGAASGSSPRVRGKQGLQIDFLPIKRLIPACAGKTSLRLLTLRLARAHPRVCGENPLVFKPH